MNNRDRYPAGGYTGLGTYREHSDRGKPSTRLVLLFGVLLGVLLTAGGMWLFGSGGAPRAVPASEQDSRPTERPGAAGSADNQRAYRPGTCLYETPGSTQGSVALQVTECASDAAVFVINHVVSEELGCAAHGDYARFGLIQQDTSARAVYCLSLVVPVDGCLRLAGGLAPQRAECAAGTRRVAAIRADADPSTACAGLGAADPWYHRGPDADEVSCLVPESG